jgi:uncharacterized repeat protein (TIGR02543 family)
MLSKNFNKKTGWIVILISLTVSSVYAAVGTNVDTNSGWIEQWGITWTFDKDVSLTGEAGKYHCGRFANGDYWVVGPVKIISITPESFVGNGYRTHEGWVVPSGTTVNGSMINPMPGLLQGYHSFGINWDANLNVAMGVSSSSPLTVPIASSLVSAISREGLAPSYSALRTAAILTVVAQAPAAACFRPQYCGTTKPYYPLTAIDNQLSLLKSLTPVANTPVLSTVEASFSRPWIDHLEGWTGRYIHPQDNMPAYGAEVHRAVSTGALMLQLDFRGGDISKDNNTLKKTLLINYIQIGIDLYGIVSNGGNRVWTNDGGHAGGRKWPILFAGIMLNNASMKGIGQKSGDYLYTSPYGPGNPPSDYIHFGEDDTTFYVTQSEINTTMTPDARDTQVIQYSQSDLNMPEWGILHSTYPGRCNKWLPTEYRATAGMPFHGTALAALMMDAKGLWNHPAYFDYEDRYMQFTAVGGDYYGWWSEVGTFTRNMWDTYRSSYGPIWPNTGAGTNHSPVFNAITPKSITAGQNLSFTVLATDMNGDTLTYSAGTLPQGATFSPTTRVFSWTPTSAQVGSYTVSFTVSDGKGGTAAASMTITVQAVNQTPVAVNNSYTIQQNSTANSLAVLLNDTDPDGDTLTISAVAQPAHGQTVISGSQINYTPTSGYIGSDTFTYTISDGRGGSATATVTITVALVQMPTDTLFQNTSEITFNASNTYQSISTTGWNLNGTTITLWANPNNLSGSHYVLGHTIAGTWSNRIQLYLADNILGLGLGDTHSRQTNLATFQIGQWYFISLSWNGTNYAVQVNGQTVGTGTYTGLTAFETFADIGNNGSVTDRTEGFAGTIDDIRVYARALSNAETTAIYNYGRTTTTPTTYTLSVTTANGTVTKSPDKTTYTSGETVTLTATANAGYSFGSWTGSATGTTNPVTITMNGNKAVTANFTQNTYTFLTNASNGTVAKSPNTATYTYGQIVTLTATANAGYSFGSWTGDATGTTNPVTVTMNSNKAVTANFTQNAYTLAITATNGSVAKSPNTATYSYGQVVTLTATANAGYSFGSWTGSATGTTNPVTITMNGNKAVTANFTAIAYTLTTTASNGSVAKSPNTATYTYGQVVTLTGTANSGYSFGSWTGDATGTANPVILTINGNKAVTANFTALSMDLSMTAHWMLDENTGTTVTDTGSSGRTAALINNPSWGFAWANEDWVSFDNQTQAIAIPANALLPQAGSIAVWVEPDSLAGTQFILGHVFNSSNRINLYSVAGKLALGLGANAAIQSNIADLTVGQPVHIALTWNGTSYAVYVNAVLKATGVFEGLTALNTTMDIGNYGDPASRTVGFIGVVEDIRTYCRSLIALEIQRLYDTYDVYLQKSIEFSIQTTDTNGQVVTYQPITAGMPSGSRFESGKFIWQPWYNQAGNYTIVFTATGQPIRVVTVSVHDIPLTDWYRQFLIYTGKLQ